MAWRQRLPIRGGVAALVGATVGAASAALAVGLLAIGPSAATVVTAVSTGLGAAAAVMLWGAREARTLRAAAGIADTALSGGSGALVRRAQTETAVVAQAVHALVARAERSSRELSQRQAYAAVGDFAAELARELAPSVTAARSALRTVEEHVHLDSPLRAPLARAQRELHRLANTLQDTLRLARSGKLVMRHLDLWVPLRATLRSVAADALQRGVWLATPPFGRTPLWVSGDQDALEQLFMNLLLNAVQATPSGGTVEVAVTVAEDVVVTITDSGSGIPAGALDRVFEPFYTTKADRAGLGLAIAWRTAAAHGGRLAIESAEGRGTTVQLALPRSTSEGELALRG